MQGLQNIGSTCAINSLIQIICRNDILREIILNYDLPENTVTSHLKEILSSMYIRKKSLIPRKFVNKIFDTFSNIFIKGEQLDIYELWIFLYGKIIEEINDDPKYYNIIDEKGYFKDKLKKGMIYHNNKAFCNSLVKCNLIKEKFNYYNAKLNDNKVSKLQSITQGFFLNITTCSRCQNVLYNFESFSTLVLNIPENTNTSISNMINQHYKEELKTDDWKCDICKDICQYKKSTKIWSIPDILFIVVNRFVSSTIKNNFPIDINEKICFNKGTVLNNVEIHKKYELSSIALHSGSLNGGHYTAICNNDDNEYLLYNDMDIYKVDNFLEKNINVYMLVYNCKKN